MSDGTLIIDTALDADGLEKDLGKLDKNLQKGVSSMAESIATSVADELIVSMIDALGDDMLEALEDSLSPDEVDSLGKKLGDLAAQAYIEGWSQGDFDLLGESIIKDVESGAKERALAAGKAVGEDVAEGFQGEVNEDTGEKAGKKVQDGLEDKLDKDDGKKLGKETGKGIGEGIEEGAKPGIASTGDLIKGILTADAIKSLAKSAFNAIKDFATEGISLASDLQEVQNVVDVTFGESAESVNTWAKNAKSAYGMTQLSAKKFNGTMGAMFKSMGKTEKEAAEMSMTMVGLAGDMASFYNLEHEEAFNKIRSGISGETEPLKQLGINMSVANLEAYALSQGMKKTYDSMTQAEQATLRYNYLLSTTADAQGDFVRNGDSYANQIKLWETNVSELKTTIGQALLPVLTDAVSWLNRLFSGTEKSGLSEELQGALTALSSVKANIGDIKSTYAKEAIRIQIQYETSIDLLGEYESLAGKELLVAEDVQRMKDITQALVDAYPELKKYVGNDGLLSEEVSQVQNLIGQYVELDKQRAYSTMVTDLLAQRMEAEIALEVAQQVLDTEYATVRAYEESKKAWDALAGEAANAQNSTVENVDWNLKLLQEYIRLAGDASKLNLDGIQSLDVSNVLGLSASDIEPTSAEARELYNLLSQIYSLAADGGSDLYEANRQSLADYNAATEAVQQGQIALAEAAKQSDAAAAAFQKLYGISPDEFIKSQGKVAGAISDQGDTAEATGEKITGLGDRTAESLEKIESVGKMTEGQTRNLMIALDANAESLKKLADAGIGYDEAISAMGQGAKTVDDILRVTTNNAGTYLQKASQMSDDQKRLLSAKIGASIAEIGRLEKAGVSYADAMAAVLAGAKSVDDVLLATAGSADTSTKDIKEKAKTLAEQKEELKTASTESTLAQQAVAKAKEQVTADSEAIITAMKAHTEALTASIKTMTDDMNQTVTDAAVGAATAGRDMAKATGDGYSEETPLKDAVVASISAALAELENSLGSFKSKGSDLIGSVAQGVTSNPSVLTNAVRTAVQGAIAAASSASVSSYGSRFGSPHRAGLEYVPYDEYPAVLHKGESVLTAAEAALWRGGMYVQEPQAKGPQLDYDAMARAIWANAPEGGDTVMVMNNEIVGRLTESTISAIQGRKARG